MKRSRSETPSQVLPIVATEVGGWAFIAQVTLYSKALEAAIAQATYDTRENHEEYPNNRGFRIFRV